MLARRRILAAFFAVCLAVPILQGMQSGMSPVSPAGQVEFGPIDEMSGIVRSGKYRDLYWVHNDSGDRARFFAVRGDGKIVTPPSGPNGYEGISVEGAKNSDWEDITRDRDTLYLSDMGNNGNARRDLGIYAVKEPDPTKVTSVKPKAFYPIAYPDQKDFPPAGFRPFDCEAIFALRGKVYFVTKDRLNSLIPATSASLYRLDTRYTDRPNFLTKLDSNPNLGGWVTGADVSPDGRTVAVLTQAPEQSIWLFDARTKGDKFLSQGRPRRIVFSGGKQCEAIAFADNGTLLVTNEQRDIYRFKVGDAKPVKPPAPVRAARRAVHETKVRIVRPLRASF